MTLDEMIVRIRVAADGVDGELDSVLDDLRGFADKAKSTTKDSAKDQAMAWGTLAASATVAFRGVVGAINSGIEASNRYAAAVKGLESISTVNGIGGAQMQAALDGVVDKFFDATSAATAFKNLLSRGYTLEQATQTITRLKDAAAFGRQANLSLKDAVVSATEGLKNENSILVDNAGVTKNVAKMWQDYAKARGISTAEMTQAMKIEAEYLGIMQETAAQAGDLQKLGEGLSGAQAESAVKTEQAYRALGEAMTPLATAGEQLKSGLMDALTGAAEACPPLTAGLTTATGAMLGLVGAYSALKTAKEVLSSLGIVSSGALGALAAVAGVLGLVAAAVTAVSKSQEAAQEAERQRRAQAQEAVTEQETRLKRLDELTARYRELAGKDALSYAEQREMVSIQAELADAYGVTAGSVAGLTGALDAYLQKLGEARQAEAESLLQKKKENSQEAYLAANNADYLRAQEQIVEKRKALASAYDELSFRNDNNFSAAEIQQTQNSIDILESQIKNLEQTLSQHDSLFADWFNDAVDEQLLAMQLRGKDVNETLAAQMREAFAIDLTAFAGDRDAANAYVDSMARGLAEACTNADLSDAMSTLQGVMDQVTKGLTPTEEDAAAFQEAWQTMVGEDSPLMGFFQQLSEVTGEAVPVIAERFMQLLTGFAGMADGSDVATAGLEAVTASLGGCAEMAAEAAGAEVDLASGFDWAGASAQEAGNRAKTLLAAYRNLASGVQTLDRKTDTLKKGQKALSAEIQKGTKSLGAAGKEVKALATDVGYTGDSLEELKALLPAYATSLQNQLASAQTSAQALAAELVSAANCSNIDASVRVDCATALSEIDGLIAAAQSALAIISALGIAKSGGRGGGGGGGGGGGDRSDADDAERLRKEAIQADYDRIAHKRHLNQISFEEELDLLEKLRRKHRLNAEEIMDWEEKVYDLKQEIRQRDSGSIDTLGDSVIDALEARYEAMRDAELERLDQSRSAWEQWRDDSVKAIEDQISALDKLADTEDREKKDQEELRKIAKLRQEIEFEQDEYNRMKLEQQLAQAMESREERLRKLALQDQKDALRAEIERIEQKAQDEVAALDREQDEIEKAYEERLKSAALQAEAERLILTQSQDELLGLLREYAPEYNATGQTLGEKLLEGFQSRVGNIVDWFSAFNAQMALAQERMAALALEAADTFYDQQAQRQGEQQSVAPVVNQTVNFYEPVESPSQTARKIAQVNEELAAGLY